MPLDVQASDIDDQSLAGFQPEQPPADDGQLREQVQQVIEKLNASERPFLLVGNGVRLAHAEEEFRELAALLDAPVGATWLAMDLFGTEQRAVHGKAGNAGARGANFAMQNSDFLLTIGSRMDVAVAGWNRQELARGAYKVMVDVDAAELAKLSDVVQMPICTDAGGFLREMLAQKASIASPGALRVEEALHGLEEPLPGHSATTHRGKGRVSIYHLAEVIAQAAGAGGPDAVSGSSGVGIEIFLFAYPCKTGQRLIHTAGLGAMGFGIAASIGVSLGSGRSRTICCDGDGGFQMNIQELATVAHHRLPLKFFVLNNGGYAAIRGSQKAFFGGPNIGCDPATGLTLPDICEVARAYGIGTARIEDQTDLLGQVKRVLADAGAGGVRRARASGRAARAARYLRAAGEWLDGFQAAGGSLAVFGSRRVPEEHDCGAAGRVLDGGPAAVDHDVLSCHIGRRIRGEKQKCARQFSGPADSSQAGVCLQFFDKRISFPDRVWPRIFCVGEWSWKDCVGAYSVASPERSYITGEGGHRGF